MHALRVRQRRRRVAYITVVVLVVAAVAVKRIVLDDTVHRVTAQEALDRFRDTTSTSLALTTTTVVEGLQLPEPGVYVYATEGRESIDALGGSSHTYPAETTITVTPTGCGVELRWDVLRERRDRWQLCLTDEGIVIGPSGSQTYHEFFGQADVKDISCDREVLVVPADRRPRPPTELDCLLNSQPWMPVWEVVGAETRSVAGEEVEVVHVRMNVTSDARLWEYTTQDWFLTMNGLPVSLSATKSALGDSALGGVVYDETVSISLTSLQPLR